MTNDLFLAILSMDAYNRTGGASDVGIVVPSSTQVGANTVITAHAGDSITLQNVTVASLTQDAFHFV
jgi:hypothetical protein